VKYVSIFKVFVLILTTIFSTQFVLLQTSYGQNYTNSTGLNSDQSKSGDQNMTITKNLSEPFISHSFYDKFTFNDKNWHNIVGNWSYILNGLQGGIDGKINSLLNNILVGPMTSNNQSIISTSFKMGDLDNNVSNYASIVNSFANYNNYQKAGIDIYKGNVYVLFSKIVNGSLMHAPEWPGLKTGIVWKPDTVFNMSLVTQGNLQKLFVNGTNLLSHNDNNPIGNGQAGLSYGRAENIVFYDFKVQ
jgi:hypothetical protein